MFFLDPKETNETLLTVKYALDKCKKENLVSALCPHALSPANDEDEGLNQPPSCSVPVKEDEFENGMKVWVKWALDNLFYRAEITAFKMKHQEQPVIGKFTNQN